MSDAAASAAQVGFVTLWWMVAESGALSGLPTLSVLCKINSRSKPLSPFACVPVLRGWCVALLSPCPPREVKPLSEWCRLEATVIYSKLLKHTFPLAFFVAVLNCLLFPCVLVHYFS